MSRVSLSPGDLVYYEPNLALAVLIDKSEAHEGYRWKYSLRSPLAKTPHGVHIIGIFYAEESKLHDGITTGRLKHYKSS